MAHLVRRSNLFIIIISFSARVEEPHVKLVYMHECKLCSTARILGKRLEVMWKKNEANSLNNEMLIMMLE